MVFLLNQKVMYGVIVLSLLLSLVAYPFCSSQIAVHFNVWGNPDHIVNKVVGLFIFSVLMVVALYLKRYTLQAVYGGYLFAVLNVVLLYISFVK